MTFKKLEGEPMKDTVSAVLDIINSLLIGIVLDNSRVSEQQPTTFAFKCRRLSDIVDSVRCLVQELQVKSVYSIHQRFEIKEVSDSFIYNYHVSCRVFLLK